jgi:TPP-dependent pyruvate/acetoin dehydrogenase alpha subunit
MGMVHWLGEYHRMWLIRYFDETARQVSARHDPRHIYPYGQEAVAVGGARRWTDDHITSTHRGTVFPG